MCFAGWPNRAEKAETRERTMAEPFLPFALPDIGEDEIAEVVDTLRSGWITTGPKAKRFEQDFVQFLGGDAALQAVAVHSPPARPPPAPGALGIRPRGEGIPPTP